MKQTNSPTLKAKLRLRPAPESLDETSASSLIATTNLPSSSPTTSTNPSTSIVDVAALNVKRERPVECRNDVSNSSTLIPSSSNDDLTTDPGRSIESWKSVLIQDTSTASCLTPKPFSIKISRCVDSDATTVYGCEAACASKEEGGGNFDNPPEFKTPRAPESVEKRRRRRQPPIVFDPSERLFVELQRKMLQKKLERTQTLPLSPMQPKKRGRPPKRAQIVWKWALSACTTLFLVFYAIMEIV